MKSLAQHIIAVAVMLAIAVPAGLLVPQLFAQVVPPQLGLGALHKVEIFNTDKCSASIIAFTNSNKSVQVNIAVPTGEECDRAVGTDLAAAATAKLQTTLDFCQPLSSLPNDDPDKKVDPSTKNPKAKSLRWKVKNLEPHLCSSPVTVAITWDGNEYNLTWRSTNAG